MARTTAKIKKIVSKLTDLLEENGIRVQKVILYGSHATNRADKRSDIDLIVISSDLKKYDPIQRLELLSVISWKLTDPLEIIGYTPSEIRGQKGKSIFWDEILETGKVVYDRAA